MGDEVQYLRSRREKGRRGEERLGKLGVGNGRVRRVEAIEERG